MGNSCPSGIVCGEGEKKVCFRDTDEERTKYGFCLTADNIATAKKMAGGTPVCRECPPPPPPPPPCPTQGYYFFGEDLGDIDDKPTVKDFLNIISSQKGRMFCRDSDDSVDTRMMATSILRFGRDPDDVNLDNVPYTTFITEAKEFVKNHDRPEDKANIEGFIDFFKRNATNFSTDNVLDIQKVADFIEKVIDTACPTSRTESYTGRLTKNNCLNFIILLVLLTLIHLMLVRK